MNTDLGLLLFRLLLAGLLFGHAAQKLFGWFRGAGISGTATVFEQWGFVPGARMVVLAALAELAGSASIATGLLTPGGCAVVLGTMTVAAAATAPSGFWAQQGGCEVPFCYGALAAVLAFTGPGSWSLDHAIGLPELSGLSWGLAALGAGLGAATIPLFRRARVLRARGATTAR
ncbi:DoxX family protein [Amycolatopsis lurida]